MTNSRHPHPPYASAPYGAHLFWKEEGENSPIFLRCRDSTWQHILFLLHSDFRAQSISTEQGPVLLPLLWEGNCWKEQNCVPAPAVNLRRYWPPPGEQCKLWCINTHWRLLRVNVIEPLGWQLKAARVCCVNTCTGTVTDPPSALSACKQSSSAPSMRWSFLILPFRQFPKGGPEPSIFLEQCQQYAHYVCKEWCCYWITETRKLSNTLSPKEDKTIFASQK